MDSVQHPTTSQVGETASSGADDAHVCAPVYRRGDVLLMGERTAVISKSDAATAAVYGVIFPDTLRSETVLVPDDHADPTERLGEPLVALLEEAVHEASANRQAVQDVRAELEEFKDQVRRVATDYAEQHDWCEVVSNALGELGLPGVEREFETTITATVEFPVKVSATSAEAAAQAFDEEEVVAKIYGLDRSELSDAVIGYNDSGWDSI